MLPGGRGGGGVGVYSDRCISPSLRPAFDEMFLICLFHESFLSTITHKISSSSTSQIYGLVGCLFLEIVIALHVDGSKVTFHLSADLSMLFRSLSVETCTYCLSITFRSYCVRGERFLIVPGPRYFPWVSIVMPYDFSVWTPSCPGTNSLDIM